MSPIALLPQMPQMNFPKRNYRFVKILMLSIYFMLFSFFTQNLRVLLGDFFLNPEILFSQDLNAASPSIKVIQIYLVG